MNAESAMEAALVSEIRGLLEKATEGCITNPNCDPVVVPRDDVIKTILGGSLVIIPIVGDWGQGKSVLGELIYRYSLISPSRPFYVTYIQISTALRILPANFINRFYGDSEPLVGEKRIPADVRTDLAKILPIIFSPNRVRAIGVESILTTLPENLDLEPAQYDSLVSIARRFKDLDRRYIIVLDDLESAEYFMSVDRLGRLLWLARQTYDLAGGIAKLLLVLLIQEYAAESFSRVVEGVRRDPSLLTAYGVTLWPPIRLEALKGDEVKLYVRKLLERFQIPERIFGGTVLENIARAADTITNTRGKISAVREVLSTALARTTLEVLKPTEPPKDIEQILKELARRAAEDQGAASRVKEAVDRALRETFPEALRKILAGELEGLAKHDDDIAKAVADIIYRYASEKYSRQFKIFPPSVRSRAKGYKMAEVIVRKEVKGLRTIRIIVWVRLSKLHRRVKKATIERYAGIPAARGAATSSVQHPGTGQPITSIRILFIHPEISRGALVQELDPETIIPIGLSNTDIASTLVALGLGDIRVSEEVRKSFNEIFKNSFTNRIQRIVDQIVSEGGI